ncbi:MAG: nucleotidyltransferase family protein [Myxococcota bacterium]|nr:nucleotidyltransferase family protein [Myxococcota bacterium]
MARQTLSPAAQRHLVDSPTRVAALVLAAGQSSRMGKPKALLPWGGIPLLEHVIRTLRASRVEKTWVVIGRDRPFSAPPPRFLDVDFVCTSDPSGGLSHSLQTGLSAVPDAFGAVAILLADQPGIESQLVDRVIEASLPPPALATRPIFKAGGDSVPGHPFVLMRSAFGLANELTGDQGARAIFRDNPTALREIEVKAPAPPDVDTPEDYYALIEKRRPSSPLPVSRTEKPGPTSS